MAHFYGVLKGQTKEVTTRGNKKGGIETIAASWDGAVKTELYELKGINYARVSFITWKGAGVHKVLFDGPMPRPDED